MNTTAEPLFYGLTEDPPRTTAVPAPYDGGVDVTFIRPPSRDSVIVPVNNSGARSRTPFSSPLKAEDMSTRAIVGSRISAPTQYDSRNITQLMRSDASRARGSSHLDPAPLVSGPLPPLYSSVRRDAGASVSPPGYVNTSGRLTQSQLQGPSSRTFRPSNHGKAPPV